MSNSLFPLPVSTPKAITEEVVSLCKSLYARGAYREAADVLGVFVTDPPTRPDILILLAQIYGKLGQPEKGLTCLAKAVMLNPADRKTVERLVKVAQQVQARAEKLARKRRFVRDSIGEVMAFAKNSGFDPGCIIDVGIATGTPGLYESYPNTPFILIDPIAENEVFMQDICSRYPSARYHLAAAGPTSGRQVLSVDPSFSGSRLVDAVGRHQHGEDREVPVVTIDQVVREAGARGPFVIKVDTEGAEMDVLEGAEETLRHTEMLILESRTWPIGNAPQLYEILGRLKAWGFVAFDVIDRNYNDVAGFLKQFDLVAVKEDGFFRTPSSYRVLSHVDEVAEVFRGIVAGKLRKREAMLERLAPQMPARHVGGQS